MAGLEDDSDTGLHEAARLIRTKLSCDAVLVTRGDRGMMLLEGGTDPVFVKTVAREVYDVTGAGDTVIATLAVALASRRVNARSCVIGQSCCRHCRR